MKRRGLRAAALLCALVTALCAAAAAELAWPSPLSAGQEALRDLITDANRALTGHGERPFNSMFECWPGLAVLGITQESGADHAEDVELTATLNARGVEMLELRCSNLDRFKPTCAALITASTPGVTWEDALAAAESAVTRVGRHPDNSFADPVIPERGSTLGLFFRYEINPYHDGVNWLTATLIPPRAGEEGGIAATPEPVFMDEVKPLSNDDGDSDWVGYFPELDDADHFQIFVTPTPEPDSAVYPFV